MAENKTKPTNVSVQTFLDSCTDDLARYRSVLATLLACCFMNFGKVFMKLDVNAV